MNRVLLSQMFVVVSFFTFSNCISVWAAPSPVVLPKPDVNNKVSNPSKVIGWPADKMPTAPEGFVVTKYADKLISPRMIYVGDNGDVFVAEADGEHEAGNRITVFRDTKGTGQPDVREVFQSGLHFPFGMAIVGDAFYVANTDSLVRFDYKSGELKLKSPPKKILDLPKGGHWTRNLTVNPAKNKFYIAIGSSSNIAEGGIKREFHRANVLESALDGSGLRVFASGVRNPVGMGWVGDQLWVVVNERDLLGEDLVPDYLTSLKDGGFYGWPFSYFGANLDPRVKEKRPDLVKRAIVPDLSIGAHVAPLGLTFENGSKFPEKYKHGAFIGEHGSWNRTILNGYKVAFVPFKDGKPSGDAEDFLTGFIANRDKSEVYGRPVGVAFLKDGSLLVADDEGNTLWRVAVKK